MKLLIKLADLNSPAFIGLVNAHKRLMLEHSPPESSHALLIDGLRDPTLTVWALYGDKILIGCAALKMISSQHGEIKAMHVVESQRGKGLGKYLLSHVIREAQSRKLRRLTLETGSQRGFFTARHLYETNGFKYCGPFGEYKNDPNSVFLSLDL